MRKSQAERGALMMGTQHQVRAINVLGGPSPSSCKGRHVACLRGGGLGSEVRSEKEGRPLSLSDIDGSDGTVCFGHVTVADIFDSSTREVLHGCEGPYPRLGPTSLLFFSFLYYFIVIYYIFFGQKSKWYVPSD